MYVATLGVNRMRKRAGFIWFQGYPTKFRLLILSIFLSNSFWILLSFAEIFPGDRLELLQSVYTERL